MHTLHDGSKIDGQDMDHFSTYIKIDLFIDVQEFWLIYY